MPPIVPVITPIKLATRGGAPTMSEANVPATPNVARPAASATKKYLGETTINLATIKTTTALASDAIKNISSLIQNTSRSSSMSRKEPPPNPVAIAIIMTPNKSNCLNPALSTPEADETITANNVIQYKFSKRDCVGSNQLTDKLISISIE